MKKIRKRENAFVRRVLISLLFNFFFVLFLVRNIYQRDRHTYLTF